MCLETVGELKVAQKDIVCYKFIVECNIIDKITGDPYQDCEVVYDGKRHKGLFCRHDENIQLRERGHFSVISMHDSNITSLIIDDKERIIGRGWHSPYMYMHIIIGETYSSYLDTPSDFFPRKVNTGLHSFKRRTFCSRVKTLLWANNNCAIVKCIIPKGAKYYEGYFIKHKSFASNKLKYVEICV